MKKTHASHCSFQHYLQQQGHGSNLDFTYIHTRGYYSAIERNASESALNRWMNLEPIIWSEVSQKEKDKYHFLTHIYRVYKNITEEFIYRAVMEKLT